MFRGSAANHTPAWFATVGSSKHFVPEVWVLELLLLAPLALATKNTGLPHYRELLLLLFVLAFTFTFAFSFALSFFVFFLLLFILQLCNLLMRRLLATLWI